MIQDKLRSVLRDVPNFPKEGIVFKDITPLLANANLCSEVVDKIIDDYTMNYNFNMRIDAVAGIESRGFFFGFLLANKLGVPFIPIRKAGKLPFTTVSIEYALEYGTAKIEMNSDAITEGMNVIIHDDLLATGGTAAAAAELIKQQGGNILGFNFIIDLTFLGGGEKLSKISDNVYSLLKY